MVAYQSQTHGSLQVMTVTPNSTHWFDVLQNCQRAYGGAPRILNDSVELLPGEYVVVVNGTQRPVTIATAKKTILWTGELLVEGEPATAYGYPMQGTEQRITSNPPLLNYALPLFPGTYTPFVHVSVTMVDKNLGEAQVSAGRKTTVRH